MHRRLFQFWGVRRFQFPLTAQEDINFEFIYQRDLIILWKGRTSYADFDFLSLWLWTGNTFLLLLLPPSHIEYTMGEDIAFPK